jgi:hypothetical protein
LSGIEHVYDGEVFAALESAIEELDVPGDADALVAGFALLDCLTAKLSLAAAEFDAAKLWELDAATSAASWLRTRAGMSASTASGIVKAGRVARQLPETAHAWIEGRLSTGQVKAITANVEDRTVATFAEQEAELLPFLAPLDVKQTATAMQHWRARAEATLDESEPRLPSRSLHLSRTMDGRFELTGSLDPLSGEIVETALRLAMTEDAPGEPPRTYAERRADASVDVHRFSIEHQHDDRGRNRAHLHVVVDYEALVGRSGGETVEGAPVDAVTIQKVLCDADVHRVITSGKSVVLDYGNATRVVGPNLWNALVLRDRHCRFEGCDRGPRFCEAHHVMPVMSGGPTRLDNLVLKCSRHHHIGHLPGWHERLEPDGTLMTTDPRGRTRTTRPPGVLAAPLLL